MGLNNSFKALATNTFDRRLGGTLKGTADPYISGYQFALFRDLPSALSQAVNWYQGQGTLSGGSGISTNAEIQRILMGSLQSVTPPGGTLNKAEFNGLGGTKWGVPTNVDYGNTLTMKFLEYSSLPILNIFHGWFRMIRDYRTGVSPLGNGGVGGLGQTYTKDNYAGTIFYWTTKPDGRSVEYCACYSGVFPTKDPQDAFTGDITASDKVEIDIEFHIDWVWHEQWVAKLCQNYANAQAGIGAAVHGIGGGDASQSPKP